MKRRNFLGFVCSLVAAPFVSKRKKPPKSKPLPKYRFCEFMLGRTMTTRDEMVFAIIRPVGSISWRIGWIYNVPSGRPGKYLFEGNKGSSGFAFADQENGRWYIHQMELA